MDKKIVFEDNGTDSVYRKPMARAKVPGGWLVIYNKESISFYPDPDHKWDGSALPG